MAALLMLSVAAMDSSNQQGTVKKTVVHSQPSSDSSSSLPEKSAKDPLSCPSLHEYSARDTSDSDGPTSPVDPKSCLSDNMAKTHIRPITQDTSESEEESISNVGKMEIKKRFKCDVPSCYETFATKFSWRRHRKKHTGERPWGCVYCLRYFGEKSTLKKHLHTHAQFHQDKEQSPWFGVVAMNAGTKLADARTSGGQAVSALLIAQMALAQQEDCEGSSEPEGTCIGASCVLKAFQRVVAAGGVDPTSCTAAAATRHLSSYEALGGHEFETQVGYSSRHHPYVRRDSRQVVSVPRENSVSPQHLTEYERQEQLRLMRLENYPLRDEQSCFAEQSRARNVTAAARHSEGNEFTRVGHPERITASHVAHSAPKRSFSFLLQPSIMQAPHFVAPPQQENVRVYRPVALKPLRRHSPPAVFIQQEHFVREESPRIYTMRPVFNSRNLPFQPFQEMLETPSTSYASFGRQEDHMYVNVDPVQSLCETVFGKEPSLSTLVVH
eukprot:gb/GEZN01004501.1/.p1 GENE.gb/GEZN01004501.1/~~gb/GEZN01004501.1/.p1  ORF type:complete len:497 (-),score=58.34 gb/GEZN01004501.1/:377-1867(-)